MYGCRFDASLRTLTQETNTSGQNHRRHEHNLFLTSEDHLPLYLPFYNGIRRFAGIRRQGGQEVPEEKRVHEDQGARERGFFEDWSRRP